MSEFETLFSEEEKKSSKHYMISQLLENAYNSIKNVNPNFKIEEAVAYANLNLGSADYSSNGLLHKVSLGLTKRTWDRLISKEIVGVQPLSGPVGLYYALRFYAASIYGGVNGQELGVNKVDTSYAGSLVTSAGEILGSNATGDVGLGVGTGTEFKQLNIKLEKASAEVKSRKLKATFSEELFQDAFNMHCVNLRDQLYTGIAKEIATEIDVEMIERLMSVATPNSLDFNVCGSPTVKTDRYNSFVSYLFTLSNKIGVKSNHGVGNYAIISPNVSTVVESSQFFAVSPILNIEEWDSRVCFAGTLNGLKIYRNIFWNTDKFLVGYKGATELDAGIFYMPYHFLALETQTQNSFQNSIGVMSRYAIGESIFGASNYYEKVEVSNMDIYY